MKRKVLHILATVCICYSSSAQKALQFASVNKLSDHFIKAVAYVSPTTSYTLPLGQEFTSLLIKIPSNSLLLQSFIVVNGDTMRFKKGGRKDDPIQGSQLLVFKNPASQVLFHSEDLNGRIEFHLYNSQPNVLKKQEQATVLPPTNVLPESTLSTYAHIALERHQGLHPNNSLSRHPDTFKRRRKD